LAFCLFVFFLIFSSFAQVGKDCSNPMIINSLPFTMSGTTNGFGMDYQVGPNNTTYMTGNDYVFSFQPAYDMKISITLSNTNSVCGLFLADSCPDAPGVHYVSYIEAPSGNPPVMTNVQVYSDTIYYIIIDTWNVANLFPSTTFNISIVQAYNIDLEACKVYLPFTSCELTDSTPFVIQYKNVGIDTLYNVLLGYQVNNDTPVYDTHWDTIIPGQTNYFLFLTYYDLSLPNTIYMVKMFTAYPGDENHQNDTIYFPIANNETVNTFPYFQNFETDTKGWSTAWIDQTKPGTSWEWGTPNKPIINSAATGIKCWVTDTSGTYLSNENSYVIGPCFDFSSITLPVIDLDIWYEADVPDIAFIEFTTDHTNGQNINWHQLGNTGDGNNWYNTPLGNPAAGWNGSSGGWLHARHALDTLGGKPYVQLRITFISGNNNVKEGFAFDNINISESPFNDLSVAQIIYPTSSCNLAATDSVIVKIINHGMNSVNNFDVKCSVDGGSTYITETIADTLNFLDTMIYKFTSNFDFSIIGMYNVIATTALPLEQNFSNDTAKADVMHYNNISIYPYIENFENNDGTWFASGMNSSWQWGIPNDTVLTTAASGTHIWATNLSGYHNLAEESYVTSPCFDLSAMTNPKLKMLIWYNETYPTYTQFNISSDGGNNYLTLGSAADPNWYNAGQAWTHSSSGWKQVEHSLLSYAGNSDIRLQFFFKGTIQNTGFAFDSIVICDAPVAVFTEGIATERYFVKFINSSLNADSCLWEFGDGTTSNLTNPPEHSYPNSDSVLVTLFVYNPCGIDSIIKWVNPKCDKPTASFIEDITIKGYFVKFINLSTNADSCLWEFGDGTTSNLTNPPEHSYPNSDSVLVTLFVYNPCGTDSIKKWVHPRYVGIYENDLSNFVKLFPNPTKDELNINFSEELGKCVIEINNIQGETVIKKVVDVNQNTKLQIPTDKLSSGLYFVKITNTKGVLNSKMIKQ